MNVLGAQWISQRGRRPTASAETLSTPLAACWLVVSMLPPHEFSERFGTAAVTQVSLETAAEFAAFAAVGVVAAATIRAFEPELQRARPPAFLFLIPIWVIASAIWGQWGPYTLARGLQLIAIAFLAWATVAIGRADPSAVKSMIGAYLRWFVRVTAVLTVLGVVFGPIYAPFGPAAAGRFTWIGAHPNAAGLILSVAIVILVSTPPRILRLPPPAIAVLLIGFVAAMYESHSRTAWACLIAGLVIVLILQGKITPRVAWIGVPLVGAVVTAALWLNDTAIWDYILRENNSTELSTGNGRIKLWGVGFRALDTVFDWLVGIGYGASRTVFSAEFTWATSAHNSLLAYLVSLGLIGVGLFLFSVIATGRSLVQGRLWAERETGVPMTALLVIVALNAVATDVMAEPTIGYAVLSMTAAFGIVAGVARREPGLSPPIDESDESRHVASDKSDNRLHVQMTRAR